MTIPSLEDSEESLVDCTVDHERMPEHDLDISSRSTRERQHQNEATMQLTTAVITSWPQQPPTSRRLIIGLERTLLGISQVNKTSSHGDTTFERPCASIARRTRPLAKTRTTSEPNS